MLLQQPEVDKENITLLGISEGTTIAPRIAVERPDNVKNIVLMGAATQTLYDIMHANLVTRTVLFAQELWDDNHDGLLSLQEVLAHPGEYLTLPLLLLLLNFTMHQFLVTTLLFPIAILLLLLLAI